MKKLLFASPLYILRERCAEDLKAVIFRLKEIGFDGIEFLGLFGHDPAEVRGWLDEAGIRALGDFVSYEDLAYRTDEVLSAHETLGCSYLTVTSLPLDDFEAVSERLDVLAEKAASKGMRLHYHNHSEELIDERIGQTVLSYILDHTDPESLLFEPDLGWIDIGGGNCDEYLYKYGKRCHVLHFKDYFCTNRGLLGRVSEFVPARGSADRGYFEFRPTGYGVMNYPELMPLCLRCDPEWIVTDHDLAYERDPFEDLKLSLDYTKALWRIFGETADHARSAQR